MLCARAATFSTGGSVMVTEATAVQLFASVTVNEKLPGPRTKAPVPVYGGVPPLAATVTVEVPPLHSMGLALAVASSAGGSVMVTEAEPTQFAASVTVKV
jgi:hypothetical protein